MDKLNALLLEQGIEVDVVSGLKSIVEQLPGQTKITLRDQAEGAPAGVGAYLVIGVVTDNLGFKIGVDIMIRKPRKAVKRVFNLSVLHNSGGNCSCAYSI